MDSWEPFPTASMAITAATPITMPSTVKPERILLPFKLSMASRRACTKLIAAPLPFLRQMIRARHHANGSRVGFVAR